MPSSKNQKASEKVSEQVSVSEENGTVLEKGLVGQTQWFRTKFCYGSIKVLSDGKYNGKDIFVHMSNINSDGFKYLSLGEVVQFDLMPSSEEGHEYYAANVSGVLGAKLVCDLKAEKRSENEEHWNKVGGDGKKEGGRRGDSRGRGRGRGRGGRSNNN